MYHPCYINAHIAVYNDLPTPQLLIWLITEHGDINEQNQKLLTPGETKRFDLFPYQVLTACVDQTCRSGLRGNISVSELI